MSRRNAFTKFSTEFHDSKVDHHGNPDQSATPLADYIENQFSEKRKFPQSEKTTVTHTHQLDMKHQLPGKSRTSFTG